MKPNDWYMNGLVLVELPIGADSFAEGPDSTGCDRGRLGGEGETLPSGMCNLRAMFWAWTV